MTSAIPNDQRQMLAAQAVEQFTYRFGSPHRLLAYHAALPLVLTPELINYLRTYFLHGQVAWEAEVDLLLSDLCRPVGYELYVMNTDVRAYLLQQMEQDECLGKSRMQKVARLLISYVRYLFQANPYVREQELQVQQWAAMVFLEDQREEAVRQIAEAFHRAIAPQQTDQANPLINAAEMARLAQLTKELAPQLQSYPDLVRYAELVGQLLKAPDRLPDPTAVYQTYQVGDRTLPDLSGLLRSHPSDDQVSAGDRDLETYKDIADTLGITLQTFEFEIAEILAEEEQQSSQISEQLQTFTFTTVTVNAQGKETSREQYQASYFAEDLGQGVTLEMVAIPGGEFLMGSPEGDGSDREKPQHRVSVQPFFMGKYPVTQAQWRVVAALPQVNRNLKPDPSNFKGDDRPVERISWHEAVEFCDRLSRSTGRAYRLPSEAEWEYACRAGTTTPFHFGQTISTDLANYDGNYTYGDGKKGVYREETTPVGNFKVANAFGLYDMHGNVWEWCADHWHDNYKNAPDDGSAWIEGGDSDGRVVRGGSWLAFPGKCRSAVRGRSNSGDQYSSTGFRVVCSASRTLS
ncbi:formylglycine-generating enzyme family protein [Pantanalinema rosaneae CENA516]|uniref:formylglycine-generating enzyme family protein n=1 Tax=Pantanalinema rosaneae TaxID=1620701 RepID=UPI003D6F25B2